MKIVRGTVIICSPGRNFVTLKLETDEGIYGLGDATLNGRELAVASYLTDHLIPLHRRPRRAADRRHLAVPLQGRLLAARTGHDVGDRRGRHGAVGHQGQGARHAGVSAARRRLARRGDGLRPRQRRRPSTRRWKRSAATSRAAIRRCARSAACPGWRATYGVGHGDHYEPAERGLAPRTVWSSERYLRLRGAALRAAPARVRARRAPAARRAPPPDADRSGAARTLAGTLRALLARRSDAGGKPGELPADPPAHHHAARGRRGLQLNPRLPHADPGTADRLHPDDGGARRRDQPPAEDRQPRGAVQRAHRLARRDRSQSRSALPRRSTSI